MCALLATIIVLACSLTVQAVIHRKQEAKILSPTVEQSSSTLLALPLCVAPENHTRWRHINVTLSLARASIPASTLKCHVSGLSWDSAIMAPPVDKTVTGRSISSVRVMCHHEQPLRLGELTLTSLRFVRWRHVHKLELHSCQLRSLSPSIAAPLSQLRSLVVRNTTRISRNTSNGKQLRTLILERGTFRDLHQLESVHLSANRLENTDSDVFCNNRKLHRLDLSRNRLKDCYAGLRGCHTRLQYLTLTQNTISILHPGCFPRMRQLRVLNVANNHLHSIGKHSLAGLKALQQLQASNNRIDFVDSKAFVHTPMLHTLDLSENRLTSVPESITTSLTQLNALNLSHNLLASDENVRLIGAIRLKQLDLSNNQLPRTPYFDDLFSLQSLNVSNNQLMWLDGAALTPLVNLATLDMSHNQIQRLWPPLSLPGLIELRLTNNEFTKLPPGVLDSCQQLSSVWLSGNRFRHVPAALTSLQLLATLDLSSNQLQSAALIGGIMNSRDGGSVVGAFSSLLVLDMSHNQIVRLSDTDLLPAWNLHRLNLSGNLIERIAVGTFQKLTSLQYVSLSHNRLYQIGQLFMGVPSLRYLDLSFNLIIHFDLAMLPRELLELNAAHNNITRIGNHFSVEHSLQLRRLDLSFNRLSDLQSSGIPSQLRSLLAADNAIGRVRVDAFINSSRLVNIDLRNNRLAKLSELVPRHNRSVRLAGNPLLCDCSMTWLVDEKVQIVDRSSLQCRVSFVKDMSEVQPQPLLGLNHDQFLCSYRTHCFALCHCCDFDACDCEMACPVGCRCYHDQMWNINIADCSASNFTQLPAVIPMDVTDVRLDGNSINSLGTHQLIGRKYMRVLYLNGSQVHAVHNKTFNGLSGLRILHLETNLITRLVGYEFLDLTALQHLFLHNNRISHIGRVVFESLVQLQMLTLNNNQLVSLHHWPFSKNAELSSLSLAANPWGCQCQMSKRLSDWLRAAESVITDIQHITCHTSSGSNMMLFQEADRNCLLTAKAILPSRNSSLVESFEFIALCAAVGVLLILVLVIFLWQRHNISWISAKFGTDRACTLVSDTVMPDSSATLLYDVFISCSAKDSTAALALTEELESRGQPPLACCLLGRNVPAQAHAVIQAASCSRRCVLLVTPALLDGEWCRFDMKAAHTDPVFSGRHKLVLACDKRISRRTADIDAEMALLMRVHPVVRRDKNGGWSALRKHLPRSGKQKLSLTGLTSARGGDDKRHWTKSDQSSPPCCLAPVAANETHSVGERKQNDSDTGLQTASNASTMPCIDSLERATGDSERLCGSVDPSQHLYHTIILGESQASVFDCDAANILSERKKGTLSRCRSASGHSPDEFSNNSINPVVASYQATTLREKKQPVSGKLPVLSRHRRDSRRKGHEQESAYPGYNSDRSVADYTPSGWLFYSVKRAGSLSNGVGETYLV